MMEKGEEFRQQLQDKMEHDAPYIWLHLMEQKEKGFDYVVYPDKDMLRNEDFSSFITRDDAKEYMRDEKSEYYPLLLHSISKITDALSPLVEQELNDFFDRSLGKEKGKAIDHEMER